MQHNDNDNTRIMDSCGTSIGTASFQLSTAPTRRFSVLTYPPTLPASTDARRPASLDLDGFLDKLTLPNDLAT